MGEARHCMPHFLPFCCLPKTQTGSDTNATKPGKLTALSLSMLVRKSYEIDQIAFSLMLKCSAITSSLLAYCNYHLYTIHVMSQVLVPYLHSDSANPGLHLRHFLIKPLFLGTSNISSTDVLV